MPTACHLFPICGGINCQRKSQRRSSNQNEFKAENNSGQPTRSYRSDKEIHPRSFQSLCCWAFSLLLAGRLINGAAALCMSRGDLFNALYSPRPANIDQSIIWYLEWHMQPTLRTQTGRISPPQTDELVAKAIRRCAAAGVRLIWLCHWLRAKHETWVESERAELTTEISALSFVMSKQQLTDFVLILKL